MNMILVVNGYGSWCSRDEITSLSDQILCFARALATPSAVALIDSHSQRHLPLLFNLFHAYAALGIHEKYQLIRVSLYTYYNSISHAIEGKIL